jgi:hypothetical protein
MSTATAKETTVENKDVEGTTGEGGIKNGILGMSEIIRKGLEIDTANAQGTGVKDVFERTLPEGLTMEHVDQTLNHIRDFSIAGAHAAGVTSVDVLKENKEAAQFSLHLPVSGKTQLNYAVNKQGTMQSANGPINYFGSVRTELKVGGIDGAEMKRVKAVVAERHKAAFAELNKS